MHFSSPQARAYQTLALLTAVFCLSGSAWAQLSAARVMSVSGSAKAVDTQGHERVLTKGAEVRSGDKVVTEPGALVQMRLNDGGYLSVRSGTEMVIDRFVYDEKDASKSNFLVSLIRGGFRSITGLIGRTNPDAYQIRTATATVGIRGTDHEPMVIPEGSAMAALGAPGLYDKVNEGETFIRNKDGMLALKRGDIGFTPNNPTGAPQILQKMPDFYRVELKTDARDAKDGAAGRRTGTDAGGLLRPSTAARRDAINAGLGSRGDLRLMGSDTTPAKADNIGGIGTPAPVAPVSTILAPSTVLQVDPSVTTIAPTSALIAPTTTLIAPTNVLIAPTTMQLAPTTTLVAPTTTLVAPTTTLVAPTTTLTAPKTLSTTTLLK